ncbi:MAG TPA: SLC13 family permease [Methylomirabilota bacterium]|nr:SLC13 family permease [Methylomirabilota bacterium]
MNDATLVFIILGVTLAAFVWGRIRYDLVALLSLFACVVAGVVEPEGAFTGFGHPAVITVAAVLVLSRGFQHSGLVDWIANLTLKAGGNLMVQVLVLSGTVAVLSAFMNNVGALALLLPVALRMAREHGHPPSRLLMPLAFGSLLGGLMTLIGTPPNIIISNYRGDHVGTAYGMFAYTPVGGVVMLAGLTFLVLLGWRLTPKRKGQASPDELFETADYVCELEVEEDAKALGWTLRELEEAYGESVPVVAVVRGKKRFPHHAFRGALREGDVLLVEAEPEELKLLEEKGGLKLASGEKFAEKLAESEDLQIIEAVVRPESRLIGRTVAQMRLMDRHGVHLLAVARDGSRLKQRLGDIRFRAGDVLLLQGEESDMAESLPELGCLPLASRELSIGRPRRLILSVVIFAAGIVAMLAGWLSAAVALTMAAAVMVLMGVLPLRETYKAIDWPVIVLLGAMIPVGGALETSGGAQWVADRLLTLGRAWPPMATMVLLLVITQALSDVVNNAAAAVLMAPVAASLAAGLGASADPFLMAVAVGASCAFLTPIGHQSNTLVMGPGGYRFGDYWKVGLPLTGVVILTAVPLILLVWPL